MYPITLAAALSGASTAQLRYWRRSPVLFKPEIEIGNRSLYSFRDVIALRTVVHLRDHDGKSLQGIRRAIDTLRDLGETGHLSQYKLVSVGDTIVHAVNEHQATDLLKHPGNEVVAELVDVLGSFQGHLAEVLPLERPVRGIMINPDVRSGYPVIEDTRVAYDQVTGLLDDGVPEEEIAFFYPSVSAEAARGAREFARYVSQYESGRSDEQAAG